MKTLIGTYIAAFLFVIISFVSIDFILMNKEINAVNNFHATCVQNIENSNFDNNVILYCSNKAKDLGYTFSIEDFSTFYEDEVIPCYYVTVKYSVASGFFGIKEESTIKGYAK